MNSTSPGIIRIGTSGIVLPGAKSSFPEEFRSGSRLHYYSSLFNTLEINSSFYKIPLPATFEKWATEVRDNFKFTVKLWRGITHAKKLDYTLADIDFFMHAANNLGNKSGCLLLQFPASITSEYEKKVEAILQRLDQLNENAQWQLAIELRHTSWYKNYFYSLLDQYKASLVLHDMPASKTPIDYQPTQFFYFRFHGPTGNYKGSYTTEFIQKYANRINICSQVGKDVYVYFNNTMEGALTNAQLLQKLIYKGR
ncbi:MAG: DUF72 domain-containing protein [Pseudomonadota bacterium]